MKKLFILIFVLLAAFGIYWFLIKPKQNVTANTETKQAPLVLKKHSENFNKSVDRMIANYLEIKNAFANDDIASVKISTIAFISSLDSIPVEELRKDTAMIFETAQSNIDDIKANAKSLIQQKGITEMREDFSMVTEMLYPSFFKTINYEGQKLFLINCSMALNDKGANWISNSAEIVNPYMGKKDPKYKAGMLHCGEVKDSIQ